MADDPTGFGRPITRFIAMLDRFCGRLFTPYLIRKNADAADYKVRAMTSAISDMNRRTGLAIAYSDSTVQIAAPAREPDPPLPLITIENRFEARLEHQQARQQENLEAITSAAAEELVLLPGDPESRTPLPEEDWVSRFFESAQNVSDENVQRVWARVLAGEVKTPGSFSLRTLDVLRNVSRREAERFEKMLKGAIFTRHEGASDYVVPLGLSSVHFDGESGITETALVYLSDAGLMSPTELPFVIFGKIKLDRRHLYMADHVVRVERTPKNANSLLRIWRMTIAGCELARLIPATVDLNLLRNVARSYGGASIFKFDSPDAYEGACEPEGPKGLTLVEQVSAK